MLTRSSQIVVSVHAQYRDMMKFICH